MALKRLMILIVFVLAAVPAAAYAENISVKEGVYISKPEISCGGEIIREFAAQTDYGDVGVKLTAAGTYHESITIPASVTGMSGDLTVEALRDPCLVMLNKTDNGWDMYVSNPKNNSLAETYIGINRRLEGENAEWDGEKTVVTVTFPQGNERGSTVKISLTE